MKLNQKLNIWEILLKHLKVSGGSTRRKFITIFILYVCHRPLILLESKGVDVVTVGDLKLCLILYADDSTLISANREGFQDSLACLYDYCTKWGLFINVDKTKMVVFRKGDVLSHNDFWFYSDTILKIVDVIDYLGINLSYTGVFFSCTQRNIADRAHVLSML